MCKFFNSYEEFPSEFALFPQNFTQLGKILQDRRSQGPDKYQVCIINMIIIIMITTVQIMKASG